MTNRVTVSIGGSLYKLVTDDDPEWVKECAAYLDEQYHSLGDHVPALTAAVLAGLTVTEEFFRTRDSVDSFIQKLKETMNENRLLKEELGDCHRELDRTKTELERVKRYVSR